MQYGARRPVVVLVGGDGCVPSSVRVPTGARVIAADSGLHLAGPLGLHADLVVGDLDSVQPTALRAAELAGAEVVRYPAAKDRTDLALALDAALDGGAAEVTVVGGHGGRLDHLLGGTLLLASPDYAALTITAHIGPATVTVVRGHANLRGSVGELVSLVPVHGAVHGVTTHGLRFGLRDEVLPAGSSRGVSNVFTDAFAEVGSSSGTLLAIQPGVDTVPATPDDRGSPP